MPNECLATVTVTGFTAEGHIDFDIDTGDCVDSDGSFEYGYEYDEENGTQTRSSRTVTWPRSHGASQTSVDEDLSLDSSQTLTAVWINSTSCNCYLTQSQRSTSKASKKRSAAKKPAGPYVFNRVYPPPLETYPDPSSLPEDMVRQEIGQASWAEYTEVDVSTRVIQTKHIDDRYAATRALRWIVVTGPVHYTVDAENDVTQETGYDQKQTDTFEESLNIELSGKYGASPLVGLSVAVKAGLKITHTTSQEWHVKTIVTVKRKYKENNTYLTWQLQDGVFVTKTSNVSYSYGAPEVRTIYRVDAPVVSHPQFDSALSTYEDHAADKSLTIARHTISKTALGQLNHHPNEYVGGIDIGFRKRGK